MSSLRKTQTNLVSENLLTSLKPSNSSVTARNLPKNDLGGVIFGCKHDTMMKCLSKQLFGLPSPHFSYVRKIEHGLPLFLFNYSDRKMHGIYEASSCGQMNIDPYAWTDGGAERTAFPAQVRICIKMQCQPLAENQFKKVIKDNYYNQVRFWFELDHSQTEDLIALFRPSSSPASILPFLAPPRMSNVYDSLPTIEGEVIEHGKNKHGNSSECSENRLDLNVEIRQSIAIPGVDRESENLLQQSLSGEEIENGKEILHELNSQSQMPEKKSDSDKLEREKETVLSKLTRLAVSRDFVVQPSFVCLDDYDMCRNVQEDIKPLASEPHGITDENMITSDLSLENSKLAEIVKVLVERTTALEKKQVEQEITIQQLRGRVMQM